MTDGWDLYAVVRSCCASATNNTADANTNNSHMEEEDYFPCLPSSSTFQIDEQNPFLFPDLSDKSYVSNRSSSSFQGLEEIYKESCVTVRPASIPGASGNQHQPTHHYPHHVQPLLKKNISHFPTTKPQQIRSRGRKNQQLKMVRQMTQEELSTDSWAWRKYGQKPIKGSPYPRNYYKCSTLKGCGARRQVERSPMDPTIFLVSYTGEHTHPRPTHRNSLAGSTRNKQQSTTAVVVKKPKFVDCGPAPYDDAVPKPTCSSSSLASASSFSPTTPLIGEDEDHDVEDILIPNTVVT